MHHIDRIERIKWLGTAVLFAAALVICTIAIGESRRTNNTADEGETSVDAVIGEDGWLYNVYIESAAEDSLCIWYDGQQYTLQGTLSSEYIGVADIEMKDGHVVQVNAKPASIEGTLDSYTDSSVQISGYEALEYADELPVYVLQSDTEEESLTGQKKLADLVVGTSQVKLVVADGMACAVIQYQQDTYENIRVLIKNGSEMIYDNLYIISDGVYTVDGEDKKKVTNVKKILKDALDEEEIRISSQSLLYLCDSDGNRSGDGYEGDFLVRKVEGGYVLVNDVAIETYLRYVLPSEMPTYFSYEALKAQAVCARTFAYKQMQTNAYAGYGANLDDSTAYQVYHAGGTYDLTDQAVADTEGLVLTYEGELIDCYYYSTCPGYSENLEVWNADSPDYLVAENLTVEKTKDLSSAKNFHKFISQSVESCDMDSPYYRWTAELSSKMGMDEQYGRLEKLTVNKRSQSGYILSLTVTFEQGERTYDTENEIRQALGKYISSVTLSDGTVRTDLSSLPSACFEVTSQKDGTILLCGGGFGHGIGLSQYGANGMGEQGYTWQEILSYYYKGTAVQTVQ